MNVLADIERHSRPEDKPILRWLLARYPSSLHWSFLASATFQKYGVHSYQSHRIWEPTKEGRALHAAFATDAVQTGKDL